MVIVTIGRGENQSKAYASSSQRGVHVLSTGQVTVKFTGQWRSPLRFKFEKFRPVKDK